jgi:hypothetical protein
VVSGEWRVESGKWEIGNRKGAIVVTVAPFHLFQGHIYLSTG